MKEKLVNMLNCDDLNEILQFFIEFDNFLLNKDMDPATTKIFYELMCKDNDGERIGDILLRSYIFYKEELTPSLISYFYLREKEKMHLKVDYNLISFYLNGIFCTDHDLKSFQFDYKKFNNKYKNKSVDDLNYRIIEIILHELWHIYQFTIDKNTNNPFEQLILNDIDIFNFLFKRVSYTGLHDFIFMIEHEADEYARRKALEIAKKENWFSENFIAQKEEYLHQTYEYKIYMRDENNISIAKTVEMMQHIFSGTSPEANFDDKYQKAKLSAYTLLDDLSPYLSKEKELLEIIFKIPDEYIAKINLGIISPLDLENDNNMHKSV